MKTYKDLTYDELYDLYIIKKLSYSKIAKMFNTEKYNIKYLLKRNGISKCPITITDDLKNKLYDDYVVNKLLMKDICTKYNIAQYSLKAILHNLNYSRENLRKIEYPDKNTVYTDYIVNRMSIKNISLKYNISEPVCRKMLKHYNLVKSSKQVHLDLQHTIRTNKIKTNPKYPKYNIFINILDSDLKTGQKLFIENFSGMTVSQISEVTGYTNTAVYPIIHKLDLDDYVYFTPNVSNAELEIRKIIDDLNLQYITNDRNIIAPSELDIYIPEKNIAIEYNGTFWHSNFKKDKDYHKNKTQKCDEHKIHLIHIYEYDWLKNSELIKHKIIAILSNTTFTKLVYDSCIIYKLYFENEVICTVTFKLLDTWHMETNGYGNISNIILDFIKVNNPDEINYTLNSDGFIIINHFDIIEYFGVDILYSTDKYSLYSAGFKTCKYIK